MRAWPLFLLLAAPAALAANCALEQFSNEPAPTPTATVTATGTAGGGVGGAGGAGGGECAHATYPLPPDSGTEGGDLDVVLALREIYVEDDDKVPVGFDLENVCTCQGQGPTCDAPPADLECDAPRGIDNNLRHVFPYLAIALSVGDLPAYYSERAEIGEWSLLMRIRDYNGEADDRQVRLSWYLTNGSMAVPAWAGSDSWHISATSLNAGPDGGLDLDSPRFTDDNAFVRDYTLVASLPEAELTLGGGNNRIVFRVTVGGLVADLREEGSLWKADNGRFFGRLRLADMFYAISTFRDGAGAAICTDNPFYPTIKTGLCQLPDILSEYGSEADPCDAISVGMGFSAEQALLGDVEFALDAGTGCPDGSSPADDECAPW